MVGGVLHAHQTGLAHEVGALAVGLDDQIAAVGVLRVVDVVEQLAVADLATDGIDAQLDDIVLQGDGFTGLCGLAGFVARHGGTGVIAAIGRCGGNAGIGAGSLVAVALLGLGLLLGCLGGFLAKQGGLAMLLLPVVPQHDKADGENDPENGLVGLLHRRGIWSVSGDAEEYPSLTPDVGPKAL